jgi:hypothetical protein
MAYRTTDPIAHSVPESQGNMFHRHSQSRDYSTSWEKPNSRISQRAGSVEEGNVVYAQQMLKNEKIFKLQQNRYLGAEYERQRKERDMMDKLEIEKKMQEQSAMKAEEQHVKSIENIIKMNENLSHKELLDQYGEAIKQKQRLRNVEKEVEIGQAKNLEYTARQSLFNETSQRKQILDRFKNEFKEDYDQRIKYIANQKMEKTKQQQEYQKLFQENTDREIANEMAYRKRFQDFSVKHAKKDRDFYNIINEHDFKRDLDVRKITGVDKMSFYDYYDERERDKKRKTDELKEHSYKSMKTKIDENQRNVQEMGRKRREEAQKSAAELQKYLEDERQRKINEKAMQNQYKNILESQVKFKHQIDDIDNKNLNIVNSESSKATRMGEMCMVPGINSVSPYLKQQRKGQVVLGEHYMKMKKYIEADNSLPIQPSLTSRPSQKRGLMQSNSSIHNTPKANSSIKNGIQLSHRDHHLSTQEKPRGNALASSGKYAILGGGADLHYDPITNPIASLNKNPYNIQNIGVMGNKEMLENLYKRSEILGMGPGFKRSYNL